MVTSEVEPSRREAVTTSPDLRCGELERIFHTPPKAEVKVGGPTGGVGKIGGGV